VKGPSGAAEAMQQVASHGIGPSALSAGALGRLWHAVRRRGQQRVCAGASASCIDFASSVCASSGIGCGHGCIAWAIGMVAEPASAIVSAFVRSASASTHHGTASLCAVGRHGRIVGHCPPGQRQCRERI
jgi:hypothetical protein